MKKLSTRLQILVCLFGLTLGSCAYRVDKSSTGESDTVDSSVTKGVYGYSQVNAIVFIPRCLGCHNSRKPTFISYIEIKSALPHIITAALVDRTMPPKGMSATERAILQKWIADGAPELVSNPSPDPAPSPTPAPLPPGRPILWTAFNQQVFEKQCLNCHFTGNKDGISDYSDINVVRNSIGTMTYLVLATKQMPPPPAKLSPDEADIFSRWVFDGMRDDNGTVAPPPAN